MSFGRPWFICCSDINYIVERHSHIIGRQIFEVSCSSSIQGKAVQDKISFLFNRYLQTRMDALFEEIIPHSRHIRVDQLTIDVGHISFESLDHDLIDEIIQKLEREISLLLLHDNTATEPDIVTQVINTGGSYLSLLKYFLLRGTLPWWAASEPSDSPLSAFDFLLSHNPDELVRLIMSVGHKPFARRRLVHQFPEEKIRPLIRLMEPSHAEFIFEYHAEVIRAQQVRQVIKNEESDFKKAVWEFIIMYLTSDRGSHFNRKEFVKTTLMSMAAHFNISFEGLLSLFASAIDVASWELKNVDSIQAIILEIAVESDFRPDNDLAIEQVVDSSPEIAQSRLDLLRYYLSFGSFPWWSVDTDEEDLQQQISVLLSEYPKTLESLIYSVGQREYSRKLMVKTFKEDILKRMLIAIEPENAEFISDYIQEVKITHTKTSLLKTQTESLREALWEFVLEYLLVDRGSEFNRQVFLESNVSKLASRYNIGFKELVIFMVNNIAVAHSRSSRHLNLFQDLTNLYHQKAWEREDLQGKPGSERIDIEQGLARSGVRLLDVLYFWIKLGYKPWWADQYAATSPQSLLEELIKDAPEDAILFLKHAGLQAGMRKRLIYQVPFPTLNKLFGLFPGAVEFLALSPALLEMLRSSNLISNSHGKIEERILLFSVWENLVSNYYQTIRPVDLVGSVIVALASWFQVSVSKLLSSFKFSGIEQLNSIMVLVQQDLPEYSSGPLFQDKDLHDDDWTRVSLEKALTRFSKENNPKAEGREELLGTGLSILLVFLQTGKLPAHFQHLTQASVNEFLKVLVLLLFQERPSEIVGQLERAAYRGEHFLRIYELFSADNSIEERTVRRELQPFLEKNILLYIQQHGYLEPGQSIRSFIDMQIKEPAGLRSSEFLKALLRHSSVSMQLAHYYKNEIAYQFIDRMVRQSGWGSGTTAFLKPFNTWLLSTVDDPLDQARLDLLFRTFNFMMIGEEVTIGSIRSYLDRLFKFLFDRDYQLMLKLLRLVQRLPTIDSKSLLVLDSGSLADVKSALEPYNTFNAISTEVTKGLNESEALSLKELFPDIEAQKALEKRILEQELVLNDPERSEEADLFSEKDKIYIHNAGLVLLHPFFSTYFNRLQMLDKGDFINADMRHRAVHLLQYLAFGTDNSEEHELVLNKLLCNMPVEESVLSGIELTEQEKRVSAELLNAVIAQWDKLKNSSPESLQVSFLQREGVLYKTDDTWNLRVEQRGYDVLLQTLPWGLGMIKTSWMTNFIAIEWT
jgi:hypothetical protein